jgi:hypothetical protein
LREVDRERARGRKKTVRRGSLENQEVIEILGAKLKLLLGLLSIEVRGLVFIQNPLYNLFSSQIQKCLVVKSDYCEFNW